MPSGHISAVTRSCSKKNYSQKFIQKVQFATLSKKNLWCWCFSVNFAKYFAKYLRTVFLSNTCKRLLRGTTNKSEIRTHQVLFQPDFWYLRIELVKSFSQILPKLKILIDLRKEMLTHAAFFMPTRQPITFSKRITILSFLPKQILLTSSAANEDNVNQSSLKSTYLKGFIQKRKRSEKNDFVTTSFKLR